MTRTETPQTRLVQKLRSTGRRTAKDAMGTLENDQPNATSRIIIREKPTAKERTPTFEWLPCDISGISSSTTT